MFKTFFARKQPRTRRIVRVAFWLFLCLAFLFQSGILRMREHNDEWMLAFLSALSACALFLPWILFRFAPTLRGKGTAARLGRFELMVLLAELASWAGSFGLYRIGLEYDSFVHAFSSGLVAVGATAIVSLSRPSWMRHPRRLALGAFVIVAAAGIGNELFEWGSDRLFGTGLYSEAGQPNDTLYDLIANAFGFLLGSWLAYRNRETIV